MSGEKFNKPDCEEDPAADRRRRGVLAKRPGASLADFAESVLWLPRQEAWGNLSEQLKSPKLQLPPQRE
ncbi:hypothetical protein IE4803_CH03413 [Rhizobium etli bv. phaseoli str. IE4803]|nr:hypothetical protein IE4803_CH03413 [Rhizobium etli bv. phaseoli str. IE4803]